MPSRYKITLFPHTNRSQQQNPLNQSPSGWPQIPALFLPGDEDNFNQVAGFIPLLVYPKTLHVKGSFSVADKNYDGTIEAQVLNHELVLQGVLSGDEFYPAAVEAVFSQAEPGEAIPVRLRAVHLEGADAPHYQVSLEGAPIAVASIISTVNAGERPTEWCGWCVKNWLSRPSKSRRPFPVNRSLLLTYRQPDAFR